MRESQGKMVRLMCFAHQVLLQQKLKAKLKW